MNINSHILKSDLKFVYNCHDKIIKSILKYKKNDILIPIFLNKMYYEYYMNRNLDDLYKTYLPILYICICQK